MVLPWAGDNKKAVSDLTVCHPFYSLIHWAGSSSHLGTDPPLPVLFLCKCNPVPEYEERVPLNLLGFSFLHFRDLWLKT